MTAREPREADVNAPAAAPELEARIEAEKANIADTLKMFSAKAENEMAQVGRALSEYALPACGAAALLGYLLAPRGRRPTAVIRLETVGGESPPVDIRAEPLAAGWGWRGWTLGGLAAAGLGALAWRLMSTESGEPASEWSRSRLLAEETGYVVPPAHVGYAANPLVEPHGLNIPDVGEPAEAPSELGEGRPIP